MNSANPIFICHNNEDFRILLRDMLTKHGFFNVIDSSSLEALLPLEKKESQEPFWIFESELIDENILCKFSKKNRLIVLVQAKNENAFKWATTFGTKNLLQFPFSSKILFEKLSATA